MTMTKRDNPQTDLDRATIDPLAVTIADAAKLSGLSRSEIYRRLATGDIQAIKAGQAAGRTLIVFPSLKAYVAQLPRATFRPPTPANPATK